jgi:hypothetical protein
MSTKHDSARERKPQDKTECRTRAEYYRGIDLMRHRVITHPKATVTAIKIIWALSDVFNFDRWDATGLYDAGGQTDPDGPIGISEEKIAELCGVSLRSVEPGMKLLKLILGMRVRARRRNFVTQRFEGADAYYFPTPKETRANTQGLRSGFSEDNALKDNANCERDSEQKTEPNCRSHTQGLRTNLFSNFLRKTERIPASPGAQDSDEVPNVTGQASVTEASTGKSDDNGHPEESMTATSVIKTSESDDNGHKSESTPGATREPAPPHAPFNPVLAALEARLAELKANAAALAAGCELTSCGKDEIKQVEAAIKKIGDDVRRRAYEQEAREALTKLAVHFATDGKAKLKAPNAVKRLKTAISVANSIGAVEMVGGFEALLAIADPKNAPLESRAALYARGEQILGERSGGIIGSLVKAFGGSVYHARRSLEKAVRENKATRNYIMAIARNETERRNRPVPVIL